MCPLKRVTDMIDFAVKNFAPDNVFSYFQKFCAMLSCTSLQSISTASREKFLERKGEKYMFIFDHVPIHVRKKAEKFLQRSKLIIKIGFILLAVFS